MMTFARHLSKVADYEVINEKVRVGDRVVRTIESLPVSTRTKFNETKEIKVEDGAILLIASCPIDQKKTRDSC